MSVNPDEIIGGCIEILERILSDDSVPRNIRRVIENIKMILLKKDNSSSVRAAMAISKLDEISNDPNMPIHIRTMVWNLAGQLERIPVD
ncbi:hypothetical protein B6V01_001685 [Methanosarcinales archaeon ex4572_44]|nr:MAG: hypothetical protein B6U67_01505 [Methanosarcinales archaeon ex4484_138]PHP45929.1 MAG: hypothetical protein B6V01_001685 [Methanosarcinales archaeon ex4572_44]RLG27048.1 MAG: hypothetical protein DRN85_01195 [Methanosarcinales archaeon]RLG28473.1 MAG: hypothetical protein DRN70_00515 [Methanosarcinales archaeon]